MPRFNWRLFIINFNLDGGGNQLSIVGSTVSEKQNELVSILIYLRSITLCRLLLLSIAVK